MKDVSRRTVFLLDGDGVVRGAWEYETSGLPDFGELLAASLDL